MVNSNTQPLGQENEDIITLSYDNSLQQLNRHIHISNRGEYDYDMSDFILKKGDYSNTYIDIKTSGIPNGVVLKLVDENDKQLYSPVDTNNHWITTACTITVGQSNIIPLPAQFNNQLSNHTPFPEGTYNWKLIFSGNDYYETSELPLTVEIRDFKVWDVLTPAIFPDGDIQVKIKTYADTLYPADKINFSQLFTANATYDSSTGIITYPNIDINTELGKHTQIINQANNCFIDYEIKNPISFISMSMQGEKSNTFQYLDNESEYYKIGCEIHDDCDLSFTELSVLTVTINGENIGYDMAYDGKEIIKKIPPLSPGIYTCTCSVKLSNSNTYKCTGQFEITTEGCTLDLSSNVDYIESRSHYFTLTAEYKHNDKPIPNATIEFFTDNNVLKFTTKTNNDGIAQFTYNKPGSYIAKVINQKNEVILVSDPYAIYGTEYILDISVDENGDLIVDTYSGEYNSRALVNDIQMNNCGLQIDTAINENEDDIVIDAYLDNCGIVYTKLGELPKYLSEVEINDEGTLITYTSTADYSKVELINAITIDEEGILCITSDINENEEDIVMSLEINDEGVLICKQFNDI